MQLLPGTTQPHMLTKRSYIAKVIDAMIRGKHDQWFALDICRYTSSIHSSLGCTPVSKFEALAGEMSVAGTERWSYAGVPATSLPSGLIWMLAAVSKRGI